MRDYAHPDIGRRLAQDLDHARREYDRTKVRFDVIMREVPSGIPHPDGTLRLQQAGKESRRALELYTKAVDRYSNFLLHGTIPEDLEP